MKVRILVDDNGEIDDTSFECDYLWVCLGNTPKEENYNTATRGHWSKAWNEDGRGVVGFVIQQAIADMSARNPKATQAVLEHMAQGNIAQPIDDDEQNNPASYGVN